MLPPVLGGRIGIIDGPGVPLLVSTALALAAVSLGDLDAIAPLLTMFFLTTYGTVNLVAGFEQLSGDPSYRPTLRNAHIVINSIAMSEMMYDVNRACRTGGGGLP